MTSVYAGIHAEVYNALSCQYWSTSTKVLEVIRERRRAYRETLGWFQFWLKIFYFASEPSIAYLYFALESLCSEGWIEIRPAPDDANRFEWRRRAIRIVRSHPVSQADPAIPVAQ